MAILTQLLADRFECFEWDLAALDVDYPDRLGEGLLNALVALELLGDVLVEGLTDADPFGKRVENLFKVLDTELVEQRRVVLMEELPLLCLFE